MRGRGGGGWLAASSYAAWHRAAAEGESEPPHVQKPPARGGAPVRACMRVRACVCVHACTADVGWDECRGPTVLPWCCSCSSRAVHQNPVNAGVRNLCAKEPVRNPRVRQGSNAPGFLATRVPCAKASSLLTCTNGLTVHLVLAALHPFTSSLTSLTRTDQQCSCYLRRRWMVQTGRAVEAVDGAGQTWCAVNGWCRLDACGRGGWCGPNAVGSAV